MIIWGGFFGASALNTGARYDPSLDKWTQVSTSGAPVARYNHTAVWTGMEMIIWGGASGTGTLLNSGAKYIPSADNGSSNAWVSITETGAPSQREYHTAVWSGTEMIIWGGNDGTNNLRSGGRYNPSLNTWISTDEEDLDVPSGRIFHTALWIGSGMVIWGGEDSGYLNSGAIYMPSRTDDYWIPITISNAPIGRSKHTAVWTGEKMIVWGGQGIPGVLNSGGIYNPLTDTWQETSTTDAPSGRINHTAVWSGSEMIIWGDQIWEFQ